MIITEANLEKLRSGFATTFQAGLSMEADVEDAITEVVNSSTKLQTYGFLGDMPVFRKWIGEKRIKSIQEKAYVLANDDFEITIGIQKNKIKDDNLGLYGPMVRGWGRNAGRLRPQLVFQALRDGNIRPCYDGQNFFDVSHPLEDGSFYSNMSAVGGAQPWYLVDASQTWKPIIYQDRQSPEFAMVTNPEDSHVFKTGEYLMGAEARGAAGYTYYQMAYRSTQPLTGPNYIAARDAMMNQKDSEGEPMGIMPTHIVVGVSNRQAAIELFQKPNLVGGESNTLNGEVVILLAKRLP